MRGVRATARLRNRTLAYRQREAAKARIRDRDGDRCFYCRTTGIPLWLDHVVPVAKGGSDEDSNLVLACPHCNCSKWINDKPGDK